MIKLISRFIYTGMALFLCIGAALVIAPFGTNSQAWAEETAWQDLGGGRARVVAVFDPVAQQVAGIVEVELKPGWITYWRNPGEAGIPPRFDFSKSTGITVSQPQFPVPETKYYSGLISVVYKDRVAFPFQAAAIITPLAGTLRLNLVLGVCENICIPAMADFSLDLKTLNSSDPFAIALINQAKAKLPTIGNTASDLPQILTVERQSSDSVLVRTQIPVSAGHPELFIEGKTSWNFNPGKLLRRVGKLVDFELDLSSLPRGADLTTNSLRLTLTADGVGSEHRVFIGANH